MITTFTDDQVAKVMDAMVLRYPDFVEQAHFVMRHPLRDNDEHFSRSLRALQGVAKTFDWFRVIDAKNPSAIYHLSIQLNARIAALLGPIGTYETFE